MIIDDKDCIFCDELALPYDPEDACALCVEHTMSMLSYDADDYVIHAEAEYREEHQQATASMVPQTGECTRLFCDDHGDAVISIDSFGTYTPAWEYCNKHAVDNYLGRMREVQLINGIMYDIDAIEDDD